MAKSINMTTYVNFAKQVFGGSSLPTVIISEMLWDTNTKNEEVEEILQILSYWYSEQCLTENSVQIVQAIKEYIVFNSANGETYNAYTLKEALTQSLYDTVKEPIDKNHLICGKYATIFEWYIEEGRVDNRILLVTYYDYINGMPLCDTRKYKEIIKTIYKNNNGMEGRQ